MSDRHSDRPQSPSRLRMLPFAVVLAATTVVLLAPLGGAAGAPTGSDKVVHGALFLLLAWTLRLAGAATRTALIVLVAYAVGTEIAQGLLPWGARTSDVRDVAADLVGVALGCVLPVPRRG